MANDIFILLTKHPRSDMYANVYDRLQDMLKSEVIHHFTNTDRGQEFIDDLIAEREADRENEEADFKRQERT